MFARTYSISDYNVEYKNGIFLKTSLSGSDITMKTSNIRVLSPQNNVEYKDGIFLKTSLSEPTLFWGEGEGRSKIGSTNLNIF